MIYLVSDGIETCGGDPVAAAKALHQSNVAAVVNIIGFDVDNQAQKQLKSVADTGGGSYVTVNDAASLKKAFREKIDELRKLNIDWYNNANTNLVNGLEKYSTLNTETSQKISKTRLTENDHLENAKEFLIDKGIITNQIKEELSEFINKRFNQINEYQIKRHQENNKKILEQYNSEEVNEQYIQNKNKIDELEKNRN